MAIEIDTPDDTSDTKPKAPLWELVLALLPISLITSGGLIGGLFGGAAAALNYQIYNAADKPQGARLTRYLVHLVAATALYAAAIFLLTFLFPETFAP